MRTRYPAPVLTKFSPPVRLDAPDALAPNPVDCARLPSNLCARRNYEIHFAAIELILFMTCRPPLSVFGRSGTSFFFYGIKRDPGRISPFIDHFARREYRGPLHIRRRALIYIYDFLSSDASKSRDPKNEVDALICDKERIYINEANESSIATSAPRQ